MRAAVTAKRSRIAGLLPVLRRGTDEVAAVDILTLLTACAAASSRGAQRVVKAGTVDTVTRAVGKHMLKSDNALGAALALLAGLKAHCRTLPTALRLSATLTVLVTLVKQRRSDCKLLLPALQLLAVAATNRVNAAALHKANLVPLLLALAKPAGNPRPTPTLHFAFQSLAGIVEHCAPACAAFLQREGLKLALDTYCLWNQADLRCGRPATLHKALAPPPRPPEPGARMLPVCPGPRGDPSATSTWTHG
jgi:hypothetical protein